MAKTKENLMAAFAGESQARNKYTFFAKQAQKENLFYIAKVFEETANEEMQHAKEEFEQLDGIKDTKANLKESISGENYEHVKMYPEFAAIAEKEGNKDAAVLFRTIAKVEIEHNNKYKKILEMLEKGTVYKRDKPIRWRCSKCGYIHEGKEPPQKCPLCHNIKEYYEPECMCFKEGCKECGF